MTVISIERKTVIGSAKMTVIIITKKNVTLVQRQLS